MSSEADELSTYLDRYPVIAPADARAGDVVAATNPEFPYWLLQEKVYNRGGELWFEDYRVANLAGTMVLRLVMRPEPLPIAPQTVIRCTFGDHENCWAIRTRSAWSVVTPTGTAATVPLREEHRLTDWVVEIYPNDPSVPKADDALRGRLEKLVEDLAANGVYHAGADNDYQRGKGAGILLAVGELRHLLGGTETTGDALPLHRTEAGWSQCSTCDGGGCPDCTDPS